MKFKKQIIIAVTCVLIAGVVITIGIMSTKTNNTASTADTNKMSTQVNDNESSAKKVEIQKKDFAGEGISNGYYTVKKNDTLFSIARAYMPNYDYNEVIEAIKKNNSINDVTLLKEGQKIVIPYEKSLEVSNTSSTSNTSEKYVVVEGDTIEAIAKAKLPHVETPEAIEKIKEKNNIKENTSLKPGDVIYIP